MTRLISPSLTAIAVAAATLVISVARAQEHQAPVVVELFTSQACSSCPPADRFLGELAKRDDVIAMSLPVDYWDHLDWEDTLSRSEHTERQRWYAQHLGHPNVYTPQMVINGSAAVIGSRIEAVQAAIGAAQRDPAGIPVTIETEGKSFHVSIGGAQTPARAKIIAIPLLRAQTVHIKRGENRGKTITYHHVSRSLIPVGTWRGEAQTLTLAHDEIMVDDAELCAVILQDEQSGAILGAALLEDA